MDYIKISIDSSDSPEWFNEYLMAELGEIGFESFLETENGFEAYIPQKMYFEESLRRLLSNQEKGFIKSWAGEIVKEQNWNEVWEKNYFKPLVIKGRCLVRAPFHTGYPHCEIEIVIEPNMAFGTGNHETTSMVMELLLGLSLNGKQVLDMGCGTGILSILASKLGASAVTAIDIDEWSYKGAIENARSNNVPNIEVFQGGASVLGPKSFDLILANIQRNVLLEDLGRYVSVMNDGGILIMSGFYLADLPAIKEKAESLGLAGAGYIEKNNWVACSFKK